MKRKKEKTNVTREEAVTEAVPQEYSVDEILAQFWIEYTEPEISEPDQASAEGPADRESEYGDFAEAAEPEADWPVEQETSESEAAEPAGPETAEAEADGPAEPAEPETAEPVYKRKLNFDVPYSLRDVMKNFWETGSGQRQPVGPNPDAAPAASDAGGNTALTGTVPEETPSEGAPSGETISEETLSEGTAPEETLTEETVPEETASEKAAVGGEDPTWKRWTRKGTELWNRLGRKQKGQPKNPTEEKLPKPEAEPLNWADLAAKPAEEEPAKATPGEDKPTEAKSAEEDRTEETEAASAGVSAKTEAPKPVPRDRKGYPSSEKKEPEEEAAPVPRGYVPKHRMRKVVEEFPDSPHTSDEPFVDTMDYSALFTMFANQQGQDAGNPSGDPEKPPKLSGSGLPDEDQDERASGEEATPLFAENGEDIDFRDILREFMMGDQHPIYADMPGIGIKAGQTAGGVPGTDLGAASGAASALSISAVIGAAFGEDARTVLPAENPAEADSSAEKEKDKEAAEADVSEREEARSARQKRDYKVIEDFPLDVEALLAGSPGDAPDSRESGAADGRADSLTEGSDAAEKAGTPAERDRDESFGTSEDADAETQPGGLRGVFRNFLAGRSLSQAGAAGAGSRKRALNEPKNYVAFDDYLPTEEEAMAAQEAAKAAEEAAGRSGAHVRPDDDGGTGSGTQGYDEDELLYEGLSPEDVELLYAGDFPSFGQWILNELMNLWIRLNGVGDRQSTATMEDEREDTGPEVNVANASRYYGSQVTMLRMRFQIGMALLAVLAYVTLGFPVSGMLKTAKVASALCLGLQLTIMLVCLDVVTNAAINLTRGRFGADSLAVLACVITCFDALVVTLDAFGSPHIPLCLFSSLALMGILFASLLTARALRKSTRVPAIGKRSYCVTAEEGVRGGKEITLLKSIRPVSGFVRRAEEAPADEMLFNRFAVLELLAALLLSLVTGLIKHSMSDFLYILSAMLTCMVPVTALSSFALPFFIGSQRIFSSGAAVAGWSGIHDIGCSRNLIVTDRDLFPEDTISIETVRIFADESAERIIAYAGTMVAASGSGLGPSFTELMERNGCRMRRVEDFQWLSSGGLMGRIEGHTVMCGSADMMQLMNVKIPYRLVDRTTVLLSIDGVLYGIFKIVYTGRPEIRTALQELIASNRHPIFAVRDFNITPEMLHEVFDVATDGYDFPPYGDRFRISEAQPSETSKVSAVVCREGLGPLTHLADTGRSMYVAVRLNMLVTAVTAVLGTLLVFVRLVGPGLLNAWLPFALMLLDALIVALISIFMRF